jgi:hypothetical protein
VLAEFIDKEADFKNWLSILISLVGKDMVSGRLSMFPASPARPSPRDRYWL